MTEKAASLDLSIDFRQSNNEGEIVNWIQESREGHDAIIINAGALTHTSVAIMDALLAAGTPTIEVHLSNIFKREQFRHHSYISSAAAGMITGFGAIGYLMAVDAAKNMLK
jgi:3-dehydroquinate dehydratase-2